VAVRFEYAPGATPIDLDEAKGLIPAHLTLQRELNEYEQANILEATEWLFARRRGDPLDERFIHVVHGRMFNQTWKWAGKSRRTDKNISVSWFEIPVRLRQMLGDVRAQIVHRAYSPSEIAAPTIIASSPFMCSRTATVDTPALWRICSSLSSQDSGSNGAAARW
jgi:fido (protein-threonine AMPylation protein)